MKLKQGVQEIDNIIKLFDKDIDFKEFSEILFNRLIEDGGVKIVETDDNIAFLFTDEFGNTFDTIFKRKNKGGEK